MKTTKTIAAAMLACAATYPFGADACTRVVYRGLDSLIIIGRSLDWKTPIPTNVYVYPAGMTKKGDNKPGSIEWTSKYGAIYAVSYDGGVTEGMNEKGLSINGLFCKGTVYDNKDTEGRPPMSLAMFVAWLLDMNETTDEVVAVLQEHNFSLGGATFDDGTVSALHWGVTDASGKTVIFEFDHGDIKIYDHIINAPEGEDYPVAMTNDPDWPSMSAIINYWRKIGGRNMLPGTVTSPDRCVRADFFINHVEATGDADLGASICRTVLHCSCVPYTFQGPEDHPEVSSTQWTSFSNLRDKRYYFELATGCGFWYIDLTKCQLQPGASVMKITSADMTNVAGMANCCLKEVEPFTPMY